VAELTCCGGCGTPTQRECREASNGICPKCGGQISAQLFYAPETPGLDLLVTLSGVLAGIGAIPLTFVIGALFEIYHQKNGGVGFVYMFLFYFIPTAGAFLFLLALFGFIGYARWECRKFKPIGS
jgi:hypothetical protein